ncbi:hypothetical protein ABZ494_35320, partial [Nocardia amamiensis]
MLCWFWQRLRHCVFAAPLWLASERPPPATASRTRRPPSTEDWERVVRVNLLGTAAVIRAALPALR